MAIRILLYSLLCVLFLVLAGASSGIGGYVISQPQYCGRTEVLAPYLLVVWVPYFLEALLFGLSAHRLRRDPKYNSTSLDLKRIAVRVGLMVITAYGIYAIWQFYATILHPVCPWFVLQFTIASVCLNLVFVTGSFALLGFLCCLSCRRTGCCPYDKMDDVESLPPYDEKTALYNEEKKKDQPIVLDLDFLYTPRRGEKSPDTKEGMVQVKKEEEVKIDYSVPWEPKPEDIIDRVSIWDSLKNRVIDQSTTIDRSLDAVLMKRIYWMGFDVNPGNLGRFKYQIKTRENFGIRPEAFERLCEEFNPPA